MSSISNRFFVTAIDDGTTLHGNLVSTKPLSQGWNGSSAVPNWAQSANQPIIYLTLMSGNTEVVPSGDVTWIYNGAKITFGSSGTSTSPSGLFRKTTYQPTGSTIAHPALKIISNLASSSNSDVDIIELQGNYEVSGANIGFSSSTQIRITSIGQSGYFGVIDFVNGVSNFTEKNQSITLVPHLYKSDTGDEVDNSGMLKIYSVRWYVNGTVKQFSGTDQLVLSESDIIDNGIIQADFVKGAPASGGSVICTAFASVDDLTDPEYMYIQYEGQNGSSATLRVGQNVTYYIWVGRMDDTSVITDYSVFYIKFLDSTGAPILDVISGGSGETNLPNVESSDPGDALYGYRPFSPIASGTNAGKISFTLYYDFVNTYGKNVTGIVLAQTSAS